MEGLLLIDKPKGISSFGVVARVRGIIKAVTGQKIKVGHSGTLDPAATGLLVLAIGRYTKKITELIGKDKTYLVEMTLGQISSTGDSEGEILHVAHKKPVKEDVVKVLKAFEGNLMQTPPIFSALKINGQRAYKLARQGIDVKLEPRPIKIYSNQLLTFSYPKVEFISRVSSGTYIRSLVSDIGMALATGAYMSNLRRTAIGAHKVEQAVSLDSLDINIIEQNIEK